MQPYQLFSPTRNLDQSELNKIRAYWGCVWYIQETVDVAAMDLPAMARFTTAFPKHIFPQLRFISLRLLDDKPSSLIIAGKLLSQSLKSLQLLPMKKPQRAHHTNQHHTFKCLQTKRCPLLTSLQIGIEGIDMSVDMLNDAVTAVAPTLQALKVFASFSWDQLWPVIKQLDELEDLHFTCSHSTHQKQTPDPTSLPKLKTVGGDFSSVTWLLSIIEAAQKVIKIRARLPRVLSKMEVASLSDVQACVAMISARCPQLHSLFLSVSKQLTRKGDRRTLQLDSLAQCAYVEAFELDIDGADCRLQDASVAVLASAWPHLQVFKINRRRSRPLCTLASISTLSQQCPKLVIIKIPIQAEGVSQPMTGYGQVDHLEQLHLGALWKNEGGQVRRIRNILCLHPSRRQMAPE